MEDILLANRVSGMLNTVKPPDRRWTESLELMSIVSESPGTGSWTSGFVGGPFVTVLNPNQSRTLVSPIFAGLFQTHYLLPGRFPITIELELVNNASQCCAAGDTQFPNPNAGQQGQPNFIRQAYSQNFAMQNVRILADVVTVDTAAQEELSRVLLSGGALPMHLTSYSTTMHNLQLNFAANQSWAVTLSRAFSRIKDIWLTFDSDASHGQILTESSSFLNGTGKLLQRPTMFGGRRTTTVPRTVRDGVSK